MRKTLVLALLSLLFLAACKKDNDTPAGQDGEFTIVKNGTTFTTTETNNTLIIAAQAGVEGRRLDLRADIDGGTIVLTVSNWAWQNPPADGILEKTYDTNDPDTSAPNTVCMDSNQTTFCDGGLGTYFVGNTGYVSEDVDGVGFGQIIITDNDDQNKTVSGTFDLIVEDLFDTEQITFEGTFTNLSYTVVR